MSSSLLYETLGLETHRDNYIAIVGGGGKTTLMFTLAKELNSLGKRVIATTSTHILIPNGVRLILSSDKDMIKGGLEKNGLAVVAQSFKEDKLKSPDPVLFDYFKEISDIVLVESDGARNMPIKLHDEHEPAIPKHANSVIAVVGMDALGKRICDVAHRPQQVASLLGVNVRHTLTLENMADIIMDESGLMKGVSGDPCIVLNKADNNRLNDEAHSLASMLQRRGVKNVVITSLAQGTWKKFVA